MMFSKPTHAENEMAIKIIREILDWDDKDFDANEKRYFIQSYLLHWADEEQIHRITRSIKKDA